MISGTSTGSGATYTQANCLVNCNNFGYSTPYSPYFTKGTF